MSRWKMVVVKIYNKLVNIIKGHYYNLTGKHQDIANKRLAICNKCQNKEYYKGIGDICALCGCPLQAKTRVINEQCEKWIF